MITRLGLLTMSAASAAFSAAGLVPQGIAQSLAKTVHILSGFTPGTQDAIARLIAGQMKDYAVSLVVETRPGASGRIAVEAVKAADADGSVILIAPLGFITIFPHIYKTLRYEPRDFTPVSTVVSSATLLTIGPKVPGDVRTLADFVAWCRANPKQATYGTVGAGTALHFIGAMLGRIAGFEFSSRALSRPRGGRGSPQRRDRFQHFADPKFAGPGPIRRSSCAGDHRVEPQPISSRCADDGGSWLSFA
jgi:tripartite-type tricarboxylate transporter receptor subunit TctC